MLKSKLLLAVMVWTLSVFLFCTPSFSAPEAASNSGVYVASPLEASSLLILGSALVGVAFFARRKTK